MNADKTILPIGVYLRSSAAQNPFGLALSASDS
jgi:hypothetical protein